jgi:hypothetical protein
MTVWDVLALGEGGLAEGKRFLVSPGPVFSVRGVVLISKVLQVTNIVPSQPTAWSYHDGDGEAFFNTRRDSRWTPLGSESETSY